ncbi:MAG: YIP1 family protein [archaeon]
MDFNIWLEALKNPKETFAAQKAHASFSEGAKHILIAGVILGLIMGIGGAVLGSLFLAPLLGAAAGAIMFVYGLIFGVIIAFLGWIINGVIYFIFAKILGGNGSLTTQLYLSALFMAPMMVLMGILMLIPFAGTILLFLLELYGLYLLTLSLKEAHGFSTGRAVLSWLLPVIVIGIIMIAFVGLAFMAMFAAA